jgi:hypothetical protein
VRDSDAGRGFLCTSLQLRLLWRTPPSIPSCSLAPSPREKTDVSLFSVAAFDSLVQHDSDVDVEYPWRFSYAG